MTTMLEQAQAAQDAKEAVDDFDAGYWTGQGEGRRLKEQFVPAELKDYAMDGGYKVAVLPELSVQDAPAILSDWKRGYLYGFLDELSGGRQVVLRV